jgi:tRNA (guanine9-N1)-methyltransferase
MSPKEINSLASQIRYCYAANKRSGNPVYFSTPALAGKTRELLSRVAGFPELWFSKAFSCSKTENDKETVLDVYPDSSKLVYLTGDSENVLEHLDDDKVYIIGGIVDRNRLKRVAIDRAETLGIATARLPIDEHLKLFATKVLTCNHVFEILLKYRENGNDWKKAMLQILPKRKEAEDIGNKDDDVAEDKKATQTEDDDVVEKKATTQTS